jgi:hypothetical protein
MSRRVLALLFIAAVSAPLLLAQTPPKQAAPPAMAGPAKPDVLYRRATEAWEAGNYPEALANLLPLMKGTAAADYRDRVALLTGELFVTTELTTDGRNPRISPNGQYVSYEYGAASDPRTRVVRVTAGAPQTVVEVRGTGLVFDAGSRIAWIRPTNNSEWAAAVQAVDDAPATGAARTAATAQAAWVLAQSGELVIRELNAGTERVVPTAGFLKTAPAWGPQNTLLFIGADASDLTRSDVYADHGTPTRLTDEAGFKTNLVVDPSGAALLYSVSTTPTFRQPQPGDPAGRGGRGAAGGGGGGRGAGGGRGGGNAGDAPPAPNPCGGGGRGGGGAAAFGVVNLQTKTTRVINGLQPTMSADGGTIAWLQRDGDVCRIERAKTLGTASTTARSGTRLNSPALSPDGSQIAYEYTAANDSEIYITDQAGAHHRVTRDIQHDILPRFLTNTTLLGMMGEPRHRRSQLYDLTSGTRTRLFANNTIRTISPEYIWQASADGQHLMIQSERDGDTVSPERGVYMIDLTRKVTTADLVSRLERQQAAENDLRSRMTKAFAPLADEIKRIVAKASISRVYEYEKTQFDFDSKYVSQPGNNKAVEYLTKTYESFGYKPEQQWFSPAQAQGGKTANVVNVLRGTENPDLIYVVSSHFDSVVVGPGADDDTSGTAALLEASRILADTPMPATIVFASFTGEEAGLLGSREFVRLAAERKWNVVGALNNDMIGWGGESARMDNTIRYSNAGIRDIQHGASFLFSNLILYDAKYYKGTDANAFYDGWGDIVGGIGSYPVLANPNYHQPTDLIETINFRQVLETAKVTAATLAYLASSPSRLKGLKAERKGSTVDLSWTPSPEKGVRSYIVAYGPAADPLRTKMTVTTAHATLPALPAGTLVAVKAVNARGLEGWDWARAALPASTPR